MLAKVAGLLRADNVVFFHMHHQIVAHAATALAGDVLQCLSHVSLVNAKKIGEIGEPVILIAQQSTRHA